MEWVEEKKNSFNTKLKTEWKGSIKSDRVLCDCCSHKHVNFQYDEEKTIVSVDNPFNDGAAIVNSKGNLYFFCDKCFFYGSLECKMCRRILFSESGVYCPRNCIGCLCGYNNFYMKYIELSD